MENALILMTRVPIPGKTKTRLETELTPAECAALHTCFIKDIYATAMELDADIFVYFTPEKNRELMERILGSDAQLFPQEGAELGERMYNGIKDCLDKGYKKCILIGTDLPNLPKVIIEEAFSILDHSEVVIGPTMDGGYYLIGMTRPIQYIFQDVFYGTKTVYESTIDHMVKASISFEKVRTWYDIDTWEDLKYLAESSSERAEYIPQNTRSFLICKGLLRTEKEGEHELYGKDAE